MDRRQFIQTAVAATALTGKALAARNPRPNVLFILADDMGYGDLSCYGRPDYKTPFLDNMAKEGMKFMDNYASAPVCTPTRTAFHTGRYAQRLEVGLREPLGDGINDIGIPENHPTIASLMKGNGYETILIGKWHLGNVEKFSPNRHGFDEFYGINGSGADYFTHKNMVGKVDLYENAQPSKDEGYLTDLFTERAIKVLGRKHAKPFFLALQYNAPHWPWDGPDDKDANHDAPGHMQAGGSQVAYGEMMKRMDAGIGRVLKALKSSGLEKNTLVVFTSDNGGERYSYNWPFSFSKLNLWEGGLRVPAIARWPGVVPANRTSHQAAATIDWTATFLAITGSNADPSYPLDGVDLTGIITGARPEFDRTLFFRMATQGAVRSGKWKYLAEGGQEHLFDLTKDPGEKGDLKTAHADIFANLKGQYEKWNAQMLPVPVAPAAAAGKAKAKGKGKEK
jgi:arylsulfatase A-like enzyme